MFLFLYATLNIQAMGQDQDYGRRTDLDLREENQECPQIESATKSLSWGEGIRNQASREIRLDFFLLRKYGAENTDRSKLKEK